MIPKSIPAQVFAWLIRRPISRTVAWASCIARDESATYLAAAYHYNNMTEERDRMYQECQNLGYRNLESLQRVFRGELSLRDQSS